MPVIEPTIVSAAPRCRFVREVSRIRDSAVEPRMVPPDG